MLACRPSHPAPPSATCQVENCIFLQAFPSSPSFFHWHHEEQVSLQSLAILASLLLQAQSGKNFLAKLFLMIFGVKQQMDCFILHFLFLFF
jgi:hypothetical protein